MNAIKVYNNKVRPIYYLFIDFNFTHIGVFFIWARRFESTGRNVWSSGLAEFVFKDFNSKIY